MTETSSCPKCGNSLPDNAPDGICPRCLMLAGLPDSDFPELAGTTPQAADFVPATPVEIVGYFPQLEILGLLGVGGMGTVYKARQTKLDRLVALKIIRPDSAEDAAFAERFNREARTLAKLSHPNIVGVHDFGEVNTSTIGDEDSNDSRLYYFVMEYVDGPNLRELLLSEKLHPDQALAIVPQICDALEFAHNEGVVHRDVKPENILIDSRGRVKIADFGLAKLAERSAENFTLTGTHQVMGTPRYMAPEQMEGSRSVDCRADIYSLGVVFYELLTGELPMGQFEPPSVKSGVDIRLDAVVLQALAREPERRYQTAAHLKQDVGAISHVTTESAARMQTGSMQQRTGASTIIEREALAAWRWLAADAGSPSQSAEQPRIPMTLMVLICVIGCGMTLLPWIEATIVPQTEGLANLETPGQFQKCALQDASAAASDSSHSMTPITSAHTVFYGVSLWPGLVVGGCFAFLTLILISLPRQVCQQTKWQLLMAVVSAIAAGHLFLFKLNVESAEVNEYAIKAKQVATSGQHMTRDPYLLTSFQGWDLLQNYPHQLTYRAGFYCSIGISIALVLLSATGIRHSLSTIATTSNFVAQTPISPPKLDLPQLANSIHSLDSSPLETPPKSPLQAVPANSFQASASHTNLGTQPRFSKRAILATCLIPFPILLLLAVFTANTVVTQGDSLQMESVTARSSFMTLLAFFLGLFPAILTTMLGSVAVSEIRHSSGRITGLGLAFFDAMLFPTLFINAVVLLVPGMIFINLVEPGAPVGAISLLVGCGVVWLNVFVLRKLWQGVNCPVDRA